MRRSTPLIFTALGAFLLVSLGVPSCDPSEAPRVDLPVVVDASGITEVTTDLGYTVELTEVRVALSGLVFTAAGEIHSGSLWRDLDDTLTPSAFAHPGHYQGGEVIGELPGGYVVDWLGDDGRELGVATLIASDYNAANFVFDRATAATTGDDSDPLVGHTSRIAGTATRDGETVRFVITVDSPEGRELVGAPFVASLDASAAGTLHLRFETRDPIEGDTLFDGLDFFALDADNDGALDIMPDDASTEDAYNVFRRIFQTHDHYTVQYSE